MNVEENFALDISYSQLVVFQKGIENPFNDWEDTHVNQGFAWRPGSVSFGSLLADEESLIQINTKSQVGISKNSIRAIVVPFEITQNCIIVASVTQEIKVNVLNGTYELVFNVIPRSSKHRFNIYVLSFAEHKNPKPRILLADKMLNPPNQLLMEAKPAI